ncbi:hypothetical protein [Paenibacillus sp. FSL H3-0333]|uniref:hypothetical protein n=1 Tax=Paenibacillus sp. FSL H3-0333 TaxID=2921373 RepID=UPI0030F5D6BA
MGDRIIVVLKEGKKIHDKPQWLYDHQILKSEPQKIKGNTETIITAIDGKEYMIKYNNDYFVELMSQKEDFIISDRGRLANLSNDVTIDYNDRKIIFNVIKTENVFVTIAKSKIDSIKNYFSKKK